MNRVRLTALTLSQCDSLARRPDMLVLELGALFHDLCDAKYLPPAPAAPAASQEPSGASPLPPRKSAAATASAVLKGFFSEAPAGILTEAQKAEICRIVDNVSWSKAQAKKQARARAQAQGEELAGFEQELIEWEGSCVELHCVSDADRLDAIGAFGILRCAAFGAVKNRTLHVPPNNAASTSRPPAEQSEGYSATAIAHFYDKLVKIRDQELFTAAARREAERRQRMMQSFLTELDIEWLVAEQGMMFSSLQ